MAMENRSNKKKYSDPPQLYIRRYPNKPIFIGTCDLQKFYTTWKVRPCSTAASCQIVFYHLEKGVYCVVEWRISPYGNNLSRQNIFSVKVAQRISLQHTGKKPGSPGGNRPIISYRVKNTCDVMLHTYGSTNSVRRDASGRAAQGTLAVVSGRPL